MIRLGIARGAIELRQTFTYWPDVVQWLFFSAVSVGVLFLMRGHHVPGTDFSLGSLTVPSMAGAWAAAGLAVAPPVLRRMARRESGSRVAARRERVLLRTT
jgi:ABC-2 type transport system permease protein